MNISLEIKWKVAMGILKFLFGGIQTYHENLMQPHYENLPTFQSLVIERFKIGEAIQKIIIKNNDFEKFKDPNDERLWDALNARDSEICYVECLVKGKLINKEYRQNTYFIDVEIPSSDPNVPFELSFVFPNHGDKQTRYLEHLKIGQPIKLHGLFDGSNTYILNPKVIVPK